MVKFLCTVISAFFVVILFQEMKGTLEGVQNRNGCLFFIVGAISFNAIQGIILLFPEERPVFLREVNNKMYSVSAYFLGKLLAEVPVAIVTPIIHACCLYFLLGFNTSNPWAFTLHCKSMIKLICRCWRNHVLLSRRSLCPDDISIIL